MARNARCVVPGVAHHVTQRGVDRGDVFFADINREPYLHLVVDQLRETEVRVLAWCSMTNHVHWVVVPGHVDSLSILFRRVHGRYAQHLNARMRRSGHLWQNRFYSCAVAEERERTALRYVERNPARAGMAGDYEWPSARAHLVVTCDLKAVAALTEKNRQGREERMKKSRLSDEQIHGAVRQMEAGQTADAIGRLKRLVIDLSLDREALKRVIEKKPAGARS